MEWVIAALIAGISIWVLYATVKKSGKQEEVISNLEENVITTNESRKLKETVRHTINQLSVADLAKLRKSWTKNSK